MNTDRRAPCVSCPYRKDAKLAFWHADHFVKLLAHDGDPWSPLYHCHEDGKKPVGDRGLCVGWLIDQKRHNIPALLLRLKLMNDEALSIQIDAISGRGVRLFRTVAAMCRENLQAIARGKRAAAKLARIKRGMS